MRGRAGEVLQRRTPGVEWHHPQVDLEPAVGPDGRLGRAAGDHGGHLGLGGERRHQRPRVLRRGQDVDVPDRLPHPAQRARVGAALAAGDGGQRRHHRGRGVQRDVKQHPLAALPVHLDAAGDALPALGPEPGQAVQPTRLDRRRQVVDRGDTQVVAELQGAFRSEAGHPGQLEDAGRYLRAQLLERPDAPGVAVFGNLGRDRGADAGNRPQGLDVELADVVGPAAHRTGRLLIIPGPEHVAPGDLGQLGVLPQQPRDLFVCPGHRSMRDRSGAGRRCRPPCRRGRGRRRAGHRARPRRARGMRGAGFLPSVRHLAGL